MSSGTLTTTVKRAYRSGDTQYILDWTSDGSGNVSQVLADADGRSIEAIGLLVRVAWIPGSGGNQPTDQRDETLKGDDTIDLFAGLGLNQSNGSAGDAAPLMTAGDGTVTTAVPRFVMGQLTFAVAGAGASKSGRTVLYFRD